jgi:arylsulfatase A
MTESVKTKAPHVLLIVADDLGYYDISCYQKETGTEQYSTPHIDQLASDGVRLQRWMN